MQLPAISSLVSLLSTSITGWKDPFKPTSLVAAAYFVLLHLVLIFPPLRHSGFAPIVAFERLPTVWQVVLGTFILFALAFILTVMGEFFLGLVNGRVLSDYVPELASKLRVGQAERFQQLWSTVRGQTRNENWAAEDAADKLAYEFPDEERDLAPTRLGNILRSPASYTYRQYGARLETIWPILSLKANEELRKQINGEMEVIIFLATMSILSAMLALEMFLVVVWFGDSWWSLLWCPVLLIIATIFYYVTFPKARAWGLGIRMAFDLNLDLAAKELGLWELTDPLEKQQRWREVSAWLSIGVLRKPSPETIINTQRTNNDVPLLAQGKHWYKAASEPTEPLTVKCPPNVTVSPHSEVIATWPSMTLPGGVVWRLAGREIVYIIAVTNQGKKPVKGTSLRVTDSRLPALPVRVFDALQSTDGSRLEGLPLPAAPDSPHPQSLLWFLPPISAGETKVLRYQVRSGYSIRVTQGAATIVEDEPNHILLKPTGAVTFSIDVMNQNQLAPLYDRAGNPLSSTESDLETEHQAIKTAAFETTNEVRIHWDGWRFVSV